MNLQDTTKKIVAMVEERTGIPVITTADPSQGTLAMAKIARHSAPAHKLSRLENITRREPASGRPL